LVFGGESLIIARKDGERMNFKVGDVVQLKSGSPPMTIEEIGGGRARCVWFEDTKRQAKWFDIAALEPAG
jgi:uncharacterized protein YodC (DUF2158 family)